MIGYFDLFPEKCKSELRTIQFMDDDNEGIPAGTYVFAEYFCDNLSCDCQRVLIKVLRVQSPSDRPDEVATISFAWNEEPDQTWKTVLKDVENPFLDPFHRQCGYANEMMDLWYEMYQWDEEYAKRIERHYAEVRKQAAGPRKTYLNDVRVDKASSESLAERKRRYRSLRLHNASKKSRRKP